MKFFNQIWIEIKNICRSKFLLIIGILILAASIVLPIIMMITQKSAANPNGGIAYYEYEAVADSRGYYDTGEEPVTVDGVTINAENPFYWNIRSLTEEKDRFEIDSDVFLSPQVLDMVLDLMDTELDYYIRFAAQITTYEDYRRDLAWGGNSTLYEKFIHEHYDPDTVDVLKEAISFSHGMDDNNFNEKYYDPDTEDEEAISFRNGMDDNRFNEKYVDITSEERLRAIDEAAEYLDTIYMVVESNDFARYIDLRIQQANDEIADLEEQISIQEQAIIDNPSQEESLSQYIEELKKQITMIKTNAIPILTYRLQENIIPGDGTWQNEAILELQRSRSQITYTTIMTEEEFFRDQWRAQSYGAYSKYVEALQTDIDENNNKILVAQKCLDTGKPDMKFVPRGARNITVSFLGYSTFIALFGVLLGGWIIASEFQQGTIRLLLIRPRSRLKILLSKFLAAMLLCFGIYAAGSLLNMIMNGVCFGFGDFLYPNVTVSGPVNFFVYYLPRFLACLVPILFGYSAAFMMSVLVRNAAVSIAVPIFCFVGSVVGMPMVWWQTRWLRGSDAVYWLAWTPVPYVQINTFFTGYNFFAESSLVNDMIPSMIQSGVPISLTYGILLLLGLSAICIAVAMHVFKKRDITNS